MKICAFLRFIAQKKPFFEHIACSLLKKRRFLSKEPSVQSGFWLTILALLLKSKNSNDKGDKMATIWQKVDKTISRLKIFQNTATIILNRVSTDVITGVTSANQDRFAIKCRAPEKITGYVNTSLAKEGDLTIIIDYLALREIYDGNNIGLKWDSHNAILHPGTDEIEFCGVVYAIREIIAEDWKDNMPGQYIVVLKGVSAEE